MNKYGFGDSQVHESRRVFISAFCIFLREIIFIRFLSDDSKKHPNVKQIIRKPINKQILTEIYAKLHGSNLN
jgi:hypothetical protein